jgi:hypothetical protein
MPAFLIPVTALRPLTIIFFSMLYPAPVVAGSALHAQDITAMEWRRLQSG